jgi:hypothetical protein
MNLPGEVLRFQVRAEESVPIHFGKSSVLVIEGITEVPKSAQTALIE